MDYYNNFQNQYVNPNDPNYTAGFQHGHTKGYGEGYTAGQQNSGGLGIKSLVLAFIIGGFAGPWLVNQFIGGGSSNENTELTIREYDAPSGQSSTLTMRLEQMGNYVGELEDSNKRWKESYNRVKQDNGRLQERVNQLNDARVADAQDFAEKITKLTREFSNSVSGENQELLALLRETQNSLITCQEDHGEMSRIFGQMETNLNHLKQEIDEEAAKGYLRKLDDALTELYEFDIY